MAGNDMQTIKQNVTNNLKRFKRYIKKMDPKDKKYYITLISIAITVLIISKVFILVTYIPSPSMEPTIKAKSFTVSNRLYDGIGNKDIVYFNCESEGKIMVKRVIATSGQTIRLQANEVYVNGHLQHEYYVTEEVLYQPFEMKIPDGYLFVMGDNRNNSKDSRYIGCIREDDVISVKKYEPMMNENK